MNGKTNHIGWTAAPLRILVLGGCTATITWIWSALALAGLSLYHPAIPSTLSFIAVAALLVVLRRLDQPWSYEGTANRRYDGAAMLLAVSTLLLSVPPGETILGGWDPGVYLHIASELDRQGTLQFEHPDLASLSEQERELLTRPLGDIPEPYGGMRVLPNGTLSPQFYHAYPTLLAGALRLGGIRSALWVNPILNLVAVLAMYGLIVVWTGKRGWALAGALALAVNPTQVWQARFSTAELLAQVCVLTGFALLAYWCASPRNRTVEALLGGAALGLAQLTRYDTLIILALALPVLLWNTRDRKYYRGLAAALAALAVAALHVWMHQRWVAPYYRPLGPMVGQALLLCGLVTLVALGLRCFPRVRQGLANLRTPLLWGASVVWGLWMLFNWWLRPTLHMRTNLSTAMRAWFAAMDMEGVASTLIGPNSRSMLFMETIFGPVGLGLALIGAVALLWRARTPVQHAWAWGGMGVTLLLTWQPYNDLFMMWVSRRYVPVVIPWMTLGMVIAGITFNEQLSRTRRARWKGGTICFLVALLLMLPATRYLVQYREWPGLVAWFEEVEQYLPEDAIVYTDQAGFAAPLRFLWQRRTYALHFPRPERRTAFYTLLEQATHREGRLYYLSQEPIPGWDTVRARVVADVPLESSIILQTRHRLPDRAQPRGGSFVLYELIPAETP